MAQDHSIKGERYWDCALCGMTYRYSDTQLNSAGLRVCKDHDVDKGDYRYSLPMGYDANSPVYYDPKVDRYYQLQLNSGTLNSIEIQHMGGWIPPKQIIFDVDRSIPYWLYFNYGRLFIQERITGVKTPLLVDMYNGVKQQLIVKVLTSGISASGTIIPMTSGEVGMSLMEVS